MTKMLFIIPFSIALKNMIIFTNVQNMYKIIIFVKMTYQALK